VDVFLGHTLKVTNTLFTRWPAMMVVILLRAWYCRCSLLK